MNPIFELTKIKKLNNNIINEIKNGAYIVVPDNGALYYKFKDRGTQRLYCEHYSEICPYDIPGKIQEEIVSSILVGINTNTWFQWEGSKPCSCKHLSDWFQYMYTGFNQGPYGQSKYTESNPYNLHDNI